MRNTEGGKPMPFQNVHYRIPKAWCDTFHNVNKFINNVDNYKKNVDNLLISYFILLITLHNLCEILLTVSNQE